MEGRLAPHRYASPREHMSKEGKQAAPGALPEVLTTEKCD